MTALAWCVAGARLVRGRVDVPLPWVARAAGVAVDALYGARIEEVRVGPAELAFRVVSGSAPPLDVDALRAGSPVDGPELRALLELVSPSFAVERVDVVGRVARARVRVRTFGLAVTLDAWIHRGRVRPRAACAATRAATAPPSTGSTPAASGRGGTATR